MKELYRRLKYISNRYRVLNSLHFGMQPNEYYLVSYPKSGNTWIRILLANLLDEQGKEIALHNVGSYIPDTYNTQQINSIIDPSSYFHKLAYQIIKTHDPYLLYYRNKKVIYIVRDGRDAINSYYHYLSACKNDAPTIEGLIRGHSSIPMGTWSKHVANWSAGTCKCKLVLRYEDLLVDTYVEVKKLMSFMNWYISEEKIQSAIELSSFEKLKQLEEKHGHFSDTRTEDGKNTPFIRKGQKGDWRSTFSEKDVDLFWRLHSIGMHSYNYNR